MSASASGLAQELGRALGERGLRVATAESCTGGAIAAAFTAVPGCSEYFRGGIVAYDHASKRDLLGVPQAVLTTAGMVSEECALALARGAQRAFKADLALATTGIAGPGGAEPGKPVGLVFIAAALGDQIACHRAVFIGDRAAIITAATQHALRQGLALLERPAQPSG